MKTKSKVSHNGSQRGGFTLVELLVVIGVIALLGTIQVSAYAGAKWRTRETMCASNVRQLTLTLQLYGGDNDNKLPVISSASWAWDMPTNVASQLLFYGLHKRNFYCPSTAPTFTDRDNFLDPDSSRNLWDWGSAGGFHLVGYVFALSGPGSKLNLSDRNTTLLAERIKTSPFAFSPPILQPNSERVLVADAILTPSGSTPSLRYTYNYTDIAGGFYKLYTSAHLIKGVPQGTNLGFKDGHVAWRKFSDPAVFSRTASAPFFWW